MISYLKGNLIKKSPDTVTIDTGGVGYSVRIPLSTFLELGDLHEPVELLIYTHMTDNALSLYGFSTENERSLFLKLISISGIGPKIALNILSGTGSSDLTEAIRKGDIARISLIPGIGKKTAMRIALELQEKLDEAEAILDPSGIQQREDLISALMNLGFKRKEVEMVVGDIIQSSTEKDEFEVLLRNSLKQLAKI
jgi:Holliday junction DNA helicase RuvA